MTRYPELWAALAAPFDPSDVKQRNQGGRALHYITARTTMNRLDDVLGPENWWDAYSVGSDHSILCAITIRLPDGSTIMKADAGGFAEMSDAGDGDKSGYSDAFKHAAVKFLVGRYLYRDGVPSFASQPEEPKPDPEPVKTNGHAVGRTNGHSGTKRTEAEPTPPKPIGAKRWPPKDGAEFYAWLKDRDRESPGIFKHITKWAALRKMPVRILSWGS